MPDNKCQTCQKDFTSVTLKKYNGLCGKCNKLAGNISEQNKVSIPKKIKEECWKMYIGNTLDGKCYVCSNIIYFSDFHEGHVQSVYDAGTLDVKNLRPVCRPCNLSCGVMNLDDFKRKMNQTVDNMFDNPVGPILCANNICIDNSSNSIQLDQPIIPISTLKSHTYSQSTSDFVIYDDIYAAQTSGAWGKFGISANYNDKSYLNNPWNGYKLLGIGSSKNDEGGIYIDVPNNMNVIWLRVTNDRWSIFRISGYLNYACGYRNLIRIRPDGREDTGTLHRWVPYPIPCSGRYLLTVSVARVLMDIIGYQVLDLVRIPIITH